MSTHLTAFVVPALAPTPRRPLTSQNSPTHHSAPPSLIPAPPAAPQASSCTSWGPGPPIQHPSSSLVASLPDLWGQGPDPVGGARVTQRLPQPWHPILGTTPRA